MGRRRGFPDPLYTNPDPGIGEVDGGGRGRRDREVPASGLCRLWHPDSRALDWPYWTRGAEGAIRATGHKNMERDCCKSQVR